jgi:hypothetical protein
VREQRLGIGILGLLTPGCQRGVDGGAQRLVVTTVGLALGVEKSPDNFHRTRPMGVDIHPTPSPRAFR